MRRSSLPPSRILRVDHILYDIESHLLIRRTWMGVASPLTTRWLGQCLINAISGGLIVEDRCERVLLFDVLSRTIDGMDGRIAGVLRYGLCQGVVAEVSEEWGVLTESLFQVCRAIVGFWHDTSLSAEPFMKESP